MNADDFGRSHAVNLAVVRAYRAGTLSSASLMVTGAAVEEAVELARALPGLAVGLHLVLVNGRSACAPARIPHLVDRQGRFPSQALPPGLRYVVDRRAAGEVALELTAQFERFAATGLALSHVDGHLHFHMHPIVFSRLLPLAAQFGARGVRLPRDDLWLSLGQDRSRAGSKALWTVVYGLLCGWARRRLRDYSLVAADRVYGLMDTGHMDERHLLSVLNSVRVPSAEIYLHPSLVREDGGSGPNPDDLAALLSPAVLQTVQARGLRLTTYPGLRGRLAPC